MHYTALYTSPLGNILLASDGEAVTGLWFEGQRHFARTLIGEREERALPVFAEAARWLDVYFSGEEPGPTPLLRPAGTPFQMEVWALLRDIPYGETRTYGALAAQLARHISARAVGGAVGKNPISILIPCHRVVGAGGSLTGYAGGVDKKAALLELERR